MKHIAIATALCLASFPGLAQGDLLAGEFGHEFTKAMGTPVWEVKRIGAQCQIVTLSAHGAPQKCRDLSESERRNFWETMLWPKESSVSASCVGNDKEIMCYVPANIRMSIDDLKSRASNYFHYDPIGGLMEVQKISKQPGR